jgi:hypothetical protein
VFTSVSGGWRAVEAKEVTEARFQSKDKNSASCVGLRTRVWRSTGGSLVREERPGFTLVDPDVVLVVLPTLPLGARRLLEESAGGGKAQRSIGGWQRDPVPGYMERSPLQILNQGAETGDIVDIGETGNRRGDALEVFDGHNLHIPEYPGRELKVGLWVLPPDVAMRLKEEWQLGTEFFGKCPYGTNEWVRGPQALE